MRNYLKLARTYAMMFEATKDFKYLVKAKQCLTDYKVVKLLQELDKEVIDNIMEPIMVDEYTEVM